MQIPSDLFFSKTHEWVKFNEDGTALIGLTDHAQEAMGDIAFINLCDEGETYEAGDVLGDVESIKAVTDIYAPVGGTVIAVNEEVLDSPELVNSDPYGSWLVELEDLKGKEASVDSLAYEDFLAEEA